MEILLPVDGRPHSQRSIELVLKVLNVNDVFVTLVHAVEQAPPGMLLQDRSGKLEATYLEAEEDTALVLLKYLVESLDKANAKVQTIVEHGKAISIIVSTAEKLIEPIILVAPGAHSAKEKLLDTSVTRALLKRSARQTIVAARRITHSTGAPYVVLVADGSDECVAAAKTIVPLLSPRMNLIILASRKGYDNTVSPIGFGQFTNGGRYLSAEVSLGTMAETLRAMGRKYEHVIAEVTFDQWLADEMSSREIALVVLSRTRADMIHRPIGGAHVESLFLNLPLSTALYCCEA
jgi:hypothetical protein